MSGPARPIAVIATSAGALAALFWWQTRPEGGAAPRRVPAPAAPSPSPTPVALAPSPCQASLLTIQGQFEDCAAIDGECPPAGFDTLRAMRVHGRSNDFILYVSIAGAYHGSGSYELKRYALIAARDGLAKVALRDYRSGELFESTAGSLTVNAGERGGHVYGLLGERSTTGEYPLTVTGTWGCG